MLTDDAIVKFKELRAQLVALGSWTDTNGAPIYSALVIRDMSICLNEWEKMGIVPLWVCRMQELSRIGSLMIVARAPTLAVRVVSVGPVCEVSIGFQSYLFDGIIDAMNWIRTEYLGHPDGEWSLPKGEI